MQKGGKLPKPKHLASDKGPKLLTSKGPSGMENECDELMESDFRRWVIKNFSELKEHVLTQCKLANNLEKRSEKIS